MLSTQCRVTLSRADWHQILDALAERLTLWQNTVHYENDAPVAVDGVTVAECSGVEEAEVIAEHYRDLIKTINNQIEETATPTPEQ